MFAPRVENLRVFVRPGPTDMRKQINGLTTLVETTMGQSVFSEGSVFIFCSRDRRILKAILWDRTGFILVTKRLERNQFPWPRGDQPVREIDLQRLRMLLDGIDFWRAHEQLHYESVS